MEDKESSPWWWFLLIFIMGIVAGNIISDIIPSDTTKLTKPEITEIEDKAYDRGYMQGVKECQGK